MSLGALFACIVCVCVVGSRRLLTETCDIIHNIWKNCELYYSASDNTPPVTVTASCAGY
jgi:hypothetical protein